MAKHLPQRLDDRQGTILVTLADPAQREHAVTWLSEAGYDVLEEADPRQAAHLLETRLDLEVAVLDAALAFGGDDLLGAAVESPAGLEVVLAGEGDVYQVTQALARGAISWLYHPLLEGDLLGQVLWALHTARQVRLRESILLAHPREVHYEGIVGATPRMLEVLETVRKAAPTDAPVVILGETGTGKELVARAIHDNSPRAKGPFVALHLHATPQGLVESELFGHKKGSFTGAVTDRVGKLELANGGTLFLDELGDIPLETQAKLLRVLETRTFEPVGANRTISSDFRLIAATNQDIETMIRERRFREELWYRIKVVRVDLPALRERKPDIPLIADRFLRDFAGRYGKELEGFEPDAMAALTRHAWSGGNIRELRNVVQSMVVLSEGPRLTLGDVPREVRGAGGAEPAPTAEAAGLAGRTMEEIERDAIAETLTLTGGNRKAAADLLQIGERTLYRKIEKFGL